MRIDVWSQCSETMAWYLALQLQGVSQKEFEANSLTEAKISNELEGFLHKQIVYQRLGYLRHPDLFIELELDRFPVSIKEIRF